MVVEILKGWGVILVVKNGNSREEGGPLCKIPSVVGVWIFSGTTQFQNLSFLRLKWLSLQACKVELFHLQKWHSNCAVKTSHDINA